MLSIFLSHTHLDKSFARRLAECLKAHGIKVWLDEAEIQVGDSLFSKIELAIRECTYLGVILSPRSVSSDWVQREVNMALTEEIHGRRVKVLPFLQEKCEIPGFLKEKLYADFTKDFDAGLSVLLQRLDSDLHGENYRQKRAFEILQSGYQDWVAFSKQDNHLLDRSTVDLVVQNVSELSLSSNLLEFLLTSISFVYTPDAMSSNLEKLRKWIGGDSSQLFDKLLEHPNPTVRIGSLTLFGLLADNTISDRLLKAILEENHRDVKRTALRTLHYMGIHLPDSLVCELLQPNSDWIVQSYTLLGQHTKQGCLLISDGTEFADEIGAMARGVGFHVVTLTPPLGSYELSCFQEDLSQAYSLVVVVRGEHFTQHGHEQFYNQIKRFVENGGTLFATPWVSWETKYQYEFAKVLPFRHIHDTYNENVFVTCRPTNESLAQQLLTGSISYYTSFELLEKKEDSTVLLETDDSVPILGYRPFGSGICYYFNTCQHLCLGNMKSPLKTNRKLSNAVRNLLAKIRRDHKTQNMQIMKH